MFCVWVGVGHISFGAAAVWGFASLVIWFSQVQGYEVIAMQLC